MPITISNSTGDGVTSTLIQSSIELPDSGTNVLLAGTVQAPGGTAMVITGSPLTMPVAPGSGSTYWIIQVNTNTGAASIKQSTSGMPLADPNNMIISSQTLVPGNTDPALVQDASPDTY